MCVPDNHIWNYGRRAVIKDVGRVMDLPYAMVDNIAKMKPQKVGVTIDSAMNGDADRDIKPNVIIWHTHSLPYFSIT